MSRKWSGLELFWIHTAQFDIKYLKVSYYFAMKLLKRTVLRNRTEEAIRKKLRENV